MASPAFNFKGGKGVKNEENVTESRHLTEFQRYLHYLTRAKPENVLLTIQHLTKMHPKRTE